MVKKPRQFNQSEIEQIIWLKFGKKYPDIGSKTLISNAKIG